MAASPLSEIADERAHSERVVRHDELTRENVEKMWRAGVSTIQIGKKVGMTKNAVVGLVNRMKLEPRPNPVKLDREPGARSAARAGKGPERIVAPSDYAESAGSRRVPTLAEVLRDSETLRALASC